MGIHNLIASAALAISAAGMASYDGPSLWVNQASDGRERRRGVRGNRSVKRAAQKRRNVIRHRKACRG